MPETINVAPSWSDTLSKICVLLIENGNADGRREAISILHQAGRMIDLINAEGSPAMQTELRTICTKHGLL